MRGVPPRGLGQIIDKASLISGDGGKGRGVPPGGLRQIIDKASLVSGDGGTFGKRRVSVRGRGRG